MSTSSFIHSLALGALLLGAVALAPPVQAQSCSPVTVVHSSYPADGAMGVPTNTPLYIYGPELAVATSLVTLENESGEAASIEVQRVDGGLLVDAFLGLEPSTTYELTVTAGGGDDEWSATFTTGTGPATPVQLRAPDVSVSVIDQDRGACGVVSAICVIGSVSARRTLEVVVGNEVLSLGGGEPAPAYPAGGGRVGANGCVEVRVREPGGSVSEATRFCGSDLGRFELAASAPAPTSCQAYSDDEDADADEGDDAPESSESGGCALGPSGAASGAGGLLLGLFVFAARCRRSSNRGRRL